MTDRTVVYRIQADIANLQAKMAQGSASVKKFNADVMATGAAGAKARAGLTTVGNATGVVGAVAAASLGAAVKAAMDWETAWAGVVKTVDGTSTQLQQLEGDLREMARTLPATHTEIAAVAEAAGQLGVATPDVAEFTRTMIMLGETTNLTAEEAATSIARLTNVMGTASADVDNIGAALVDLGNSSATTEAEILTLAQRLSAAGSIAGLSESDVLGFAAALSSVGVEAEAGGTALSKVFTAVRDASIDGGDKLETFARVAGVTAEEFRAAFADDAAGAISMFVSGLGEINDAGESTSQVFKDLGLTDQRLSRALLSTASAGDLLGDSLSRSADAFADNAALTAEFDKRLETTAAQVQISWNNIKDAGIDAGASLLPVVEEVAGAVSGMAQAFGDLPGPVQKTATGLAGITAILGGGLWFTSKVVNGVASTSQALQDLGVNAGKAQGAMRGVVRAGAGLASVVITANLLQEAFEKIADTRIDGGTLFRDLEALADDRPTANLENLYSIFQDIDDKWQRNANPLSWISSWDPSGFEAARDSVEELDQALASLVEAGQAEMAAAAFERISDKAKDAGRSTEEITDLFPEYGTALDNAASANDAAAAATQRATAATEEQTASLKDLLDAMEKQREAALRNADAQINWRASVLDAKDALKENGRTLNINTRAGQANRQALNGMIEGWNGLTRGQQSAKGAFKSARQEIIDQAVAFGMSREEARKYVDKLIEVPKQKLKNEPEFDDDKARRDIEAYRRELASLDGRVVRTTVINTILTRQQRQTGVGGPIDPNVAPRSSGGGGAGATSPRSYAGGASATAPRVAASSVAGADPAAIQRALAAVLASTSLNVTGVDPGRAALFSVGGDY